MSINNIENIAFNYLTNLTTINADEVNTDILTKVDPDISDLQFDMLEGIRTDETIQQQIDNIETQIGNIGASYWLSAWDTTTQTNPVANTPRIVTWNNSDPSGNGIVAGPTTGSIKVLNTNAYNIQFSFQLHQTSSSTANVTIWLRKNGTDILASAGEYDVKGNDHIISAWNYVMVLEANDYIQFVWASDSTSMTLAYQAAQTSPYTHPAIPSVIITVTNVTGEGPQGPAGPAGPRGPQGERGPRGYKGEAGDGTVDDTARALAGTALALATTAQATAIGAAATAAGAVAANGTQDIAIGVLQVKTQKIQYDVGSDSTEISNNITMPNYDNPFTEPPAVVIKNDSQSVFRYGLTSSDLISTTNRFISTSGQSYVNSLGINTDLEVGTTSNMLGSVFIGRDNNSQKKIILYDNNSGNDYDYTGIWVDNSLGGNNFNCEIDGNEGSAFSWYAGDGFGLTRTLIKEITSTTEFSTTEEAIFLKQNANTQKIRLVRDVANSNVQITFTGDTTGLGDYDGRIIQQEGAGLTEGTGIMTIESGTININSLVADVTLTSNAKVNINADDELNIAATSILGSINISTDTSDIGLTSAAALNLNSNAGMNVTSTRAANNAITFTTNTTDNDITLTNATTNNFKINSGGILNVNVNDEININSSSVLGKIKLNTAANDIELNSGAGITATGGIISATSTNAINLTNTKTSGDSITLTSNTANTTDNDLVLTNSNILSNIFKVKATGGLKIDSTTQFDLLVNDTINIETTSVGVDLKLTAAQDMKLTSDSNMFIKSTYSKIDLTTLSSANGLINLQSAKDLILTSATISQINCGTFDVNSSGGGSIDVAGSLSLTSTSTSAASSFLFTSATTSGYDITLNNTSALNYKIRSLDDLQISTAASKKLELSAGTGGMFLSSDQLITLNAVSDIDITSSANDINLTASDIRYTSTTGAVSMTSKSGGGLTTETGTLSLISLAGDLTTDAYGSNVMDGGSIVITSASTSQLTSTSNTTITSSTGNVALSATSGNISLQSGNDLTLIGVNTNITGSTAINLKNQIYFDRTPNAGQYTTSSNAIGFTNSINAGTAYSGTASDNNTPAQVGSFTLPARGVWFIQVSVKITLNGGSDTITNRVIAVSESSASDVEIAPCFVYADPIDDGAGSAGERQNISLSGIFHWTATATKQLFINAIVQTSGSRTVTVSGNIKYTRIA